MSVDNVPHEADESESRYEPMPVLVWESGVGIVGSGRRSLVGEGSDPLVPAHVAERTPVIPQRVLRRNTTDAPSQVVAQAACWLQLGQLARVAGLGAREALSHLDARVPHQPCGTLP